MIVPLARPSMLTSIEGSIDSEVNGGSPKFWRKASQMLESMGGRGMTARRNGHVDD
jgi:hypothetical protein